MLAQLSHPALGRGRRRARPEQQIVKAIYYILRAGCPCRLLRDGGVREALNHHHVVLDH